MRKVIPTSQGSKVIIEDNRRINSTLSTWTLNSTTLKLLTARWVAIMKLLESTKILILLLEATLKQHHISHCNRAQEICMQIIEKESNSMIIDNSLQHQIFKCMTTDLVDQWSIFRMLLKSQWLLQRHLHTYIILDKGFNNQTSHYWVCLGMRRCPQWSIGNKALGYHLEAIRLLKTTSQEIRLSDISLRVNMGNDLDLGQMLSLAKVHHLALTNASILLA